MYTQESYLDQTPGRQSLRPSEFFARHYDNDEVLFNPNFNTPNQVRFSQFKSPISRSKRSLSPLDNRLGSIVEEDESEGRPSDLVGLNPRSSNAPMNRRYQSQTNLSGSKSNFKFGRRDLNASHDSAHSRSRQGDNFFGYNRFTNQPSQLDSHRSLNTRHMDDRITNSRKYLKVKIKASKILISLILICLKKF